MWRVHRLDRIKREKTGQSFDSQSLALKFRSKQIGRFFCVMRIRGIGVPKRLGDKYGLIGDRAVDSS
jgi:hypothetical protein